MLALFSGKTYVRIANAWDVTDLAGTGSTGDRRYTVHWDFNPAIIAALDPTPNADFLDVSRVDWFYYDVRYVCENGLMNGTSASFMPMGTITFLGFATAEPSTVMHFSTSGIPVLQ